ncbi:MAG: redox-sensing transcriptional repressor Rex [Negativicutes bacterium]|nr:redox-sensing transcriptional repressor Rex [Negativicutes bacterium]
MKNRKPISMQTLKRLPDYLHYLQTINHKEVTSISATMIANSLKLNEVQVRKDLAAVSMTGGKPRTGFNINELTKGIESRLGYDSKDEAVLVGVGKLGQALLTYPGFQTYGLNIVAGFDSNPNLHHMTIEGKLILPMGKFINLCQSRKIHIGIITVPADQAQSVCDLMLAGGIIAIWNFAPVNLKVPDGIFIKSENMSASLAMISQFLAEHLPDSN